MWVMRWLLRGRLVRLMPNLGLPDRAHQSHSPKVPPEYAPAAVDPAAIGPTGQVSLAEPAVHVIGSPGVVRGPEHLLRRARLDDVPWRLVGREEERALLRDTGGLLHVVGHNHDRYLVAQFGDRVLDPSG